MNIGSKIKRLRLQAGLSQKQLAGDCVSRVMVSLIESGKANPSLRTINALAVKLGVPADTLLDVSEDSDTLDSALCKAERSLSAHPEAALHYAKFAHAIAVREGDLQNQGLASYWVGMAEELVGVPADSIRSLQRALFLLDSTTQKDIIITCWFHLGNGYFRCERYQEAAYHYERAMQASLGHKKHEDLHIRSSLYRSTCLCRCGLQSDAMESYKETYTRAENYWDPALRLEVALGYCWSLYKSGNTAEAIRESRRVIRNNPSMNQVILYQIKHNLGIFLSREGWWSEAHTLWEECRTAYKRLSSPQHLVSTLEEICGYWIHQGDLPRVAELCDEACSILDRYNLLRPRARMSIVRGKLLTLQGQAALAKEYFRLALSIFETLQDVDGIAEAKNLMQQHTLMV